MTKVLFLDIDGVLNSNFWNDNHQREISDGILIDEQKIKLLAQLVKKTKAKIILHSGWRVWFDDKLNPTRKEAQRLVEMLAMEGLAIDGVTPDLTTEEIRRTKRFSMVKADEILLWLKEHEDVSAWVVLDDLDLHNIQVEEYQVKPDQRVGLTMDDVRLAEDILLEVKMDISNLEKGHFERTEKAANYLLGLVLEGKKRATSSSLWAYEIEGEAVPKVGDRYVITYWDGTPGCVIETTNVRIIPYADMTYEIARLEGEDDTLESWQKTHQQFFTEEGKELGYIFSENMPVVFEEFKVIEML